MPRRRTCTPCSYNAIYRTAHPQLIRSSSMASNSSLLNGIDRISVPNASLRDVII